MPPNATRYFATLRVLVCFGVLVPLNAAQAANSSDPDWPCIQRRADQLSVAQMWAEPLPEQATTLPPEAHALAQHLALRRLPLEQAEQEVKTFVSRHGNDDPAVLGLIFKRAFDDINALRSRLIAGIVRYARKQAALAERIDNKRIEMKNLLATTPPDFDRIDALEAEIDWDERIFQDRARALTYVCESPVLLEQRAFAIARILSQARENANP